MGWKIKWGNFLGSRIFLKGDRIYKKIRKLVNFWEFFFNLIGVLEEGRNYLKILENCLKLKDRVFRL